MRYSDKLRAMAEYFDNHPEIESELGDWDVPSVSLWPNDADQFSYLCRELGGFTKSAYNGTVTARHSLTNWDNPNRDAYIVSVHLAGACTKVPVLNEDGTPKMEPETQYKSEPTGKMVPVVEYHCPESFLNL